MSSGTFFIRGSTIFPGYSTRELVFIHLPLHFPYISSPTAPIHVKSGIYGKPLSRRIQRRRLRGSRTSLHRGRRQLPEQHSSDQIQDIAGFQIGSPFFWPFPLTRPTSSLNSTMIWKVQRSEEHTSELQSHSDLVCRLLLEKKKKNSYERSYSIRSTTW